MPNIRKQKSSKMQTGKGRQVDRIVFDDDARREYLTGFHKRKVQKKEAEKKAAIARQKRVRRETRAENRKLLAEQARENVRIVEQAYGGNTGDFEAEEIHSESDALDPVEYEDEEQMATVTIIEDLDVQAPTETDGPPLQKPQQSADKSAGDGAKAKNTALSHKSSKFASPKKRKKRSDFHYSTRSERMQERANQLAKRKRGEGDGARRQGHRRQVK